MKKKKTWLSLAFISACSLSFLAGCTRTAFTGKVFLDYGVIRDKDIENITDLPELDYNKLKSTIASGESFMLVLYNSGCGCWTDFQPVITRFINDSNVYVKYINVDEFAGESDRFGLYIERVDMPSVALFRRGKLVRQFSYGINDTKMFKNYESFEAFVSENIVLPKMYYLERDVLDSYIAEDKDFVLYIAKGSCHDCRDANSDVLFPWSDNHIASNKYLYIFDIDPYMGTDIYQDIKDEYGLSPKYNPVLGYELFGGVVPTFQHRQGGQYLDMISVLNDMAKKDTSTIYSYFTEERVAAMPFLKDSSLTTALNNMSLTSEQVENWGEYKAEYYRNYHYPILNLFLDTYL